RHGRRAAAHHGRDTPAHPGTLSARSDGDNRRDRDDRRVPVLRRCVVHYRRNPRRRWRFVASLGPGPRHGLTPGPTTNVQQSLPFDSTPEHRSAPVPQPLRVEAAQHPDTSAPAHPAPPHLRTQAPAHPSTPAPTHPSTLYVRHPRARRYVVRVRADGTVRVT